MSDPHCPVCHGTGWDGDGYTLSCSRCSPSVMDLHVDRTCGRERDPNTGILKEQAEAIASVFLGDPNMECRATGVTEFGVTGTVVPRSMKEIKCEICGAPPAFPAVVTEPYTCSTCQAMAHFEAWRLVKDTMGGAEKSQVVYVDEGVAKLVVSNKPSEEFVNWTIEKVKVRRLNATEGAVGREVVSLNRETLRDALRQSGLNKLTHLEREALGLV